MFGKLKAKTLMIGDEVYADSHSGLKNTNFLKIKNHNFRIFYDKIMMSNELPIFFVSKFPGA